MAARNPYAAPTSNVAREVSPGEYGEIRMFSPHGRIGRVRYIGYTFGLSILVLIVFGLLAGIAALADPSAAVLVGIAGYVVMLVVQVLLTIQRSHDMNVTGWLSLILLVPLAALIFWFVPGTRGENTYGLRPPPNTAGVIVLACIVPFLFIGGILAAVAIPAYQDYTIRAQVSEGLMMAAEPKAAVAEAFGRTRSPPADRVDAGMSPAPTDTAGRYVASIDIAGGTILVMYGDNANSAIAGKILAMQPFLAPDNSVVWRCGYAAAPANVAMDGGAPDSYQATEIEPQYLPSGCRP